MQPQVRPKTDEGINPLEEALREKFSPKPKRMKPRKRRRLKRVKRREPAAV